jgi:hypothetical protein
MKLDENNEPPNRATGEGCETLSNTGNPNHYIRTQCLKYPTQANLRGNLGRDTVIGPGLSESGFLISQEQPRAEDLRGLHGAVPGGVFQCVQPRQLCFASG